MTNKLIILTTTGSEDEARKIAEALVERRLAACVNIVSQVHSVYRWRGEVEQADEYLLLVKTVREREEQVRATIRELHSYEIPECIAIQIEGGSAEYLKWIEDSI